MLGAVLALMNVCFYLAIDRLPLGTVGAIEFLGPIGLAALGMRSKRNLAALAIRSQATPIGSTCANSRTANAGPR